MSAKLVMIEFVTHLLNCYFIQLLCLSNGRRHWYEFEFMNQIILWNLEYYQKQLRQFLMPISVLCKLFFRLDAMLYKHCRKDAKKFCHAPENWHDADSTNPEQGPWTLGCLYRNMKQSIKDPDHQVRLDWYWRIKNWIFSDSIEIQQKTWCFLRSERPEKLFSLTTNHPF